MALIALPATGDLLVDRPCPTTVLNVPEDSEMAMHLFDHFHNCFFNDHTAF